MTAYFSPQYKADFKRQEHFFSNVMEKSLKFLYSDCLWTYRERGGEEVSLADNEELRGEGPGLPSYLAETGYFLLT